MTWAAVADMPGLEYHAAGHRYRYRGVRIPGVTEILDVGGWTRDIPEEIRRLLRMHRARRRGLVVHDLASRRDLGENVDLHIDASTAEYMDADTLYRQLTGFTPIDTEVCLVHPTFRYAGRYDVTGWLLTAKAEPLRVLLDRKTGMTIHPSVWLQVAAYRGLREFWYPSQRIDRTGVLLLQPTGSQRLVWNPYEGTAWAVFISAVWRYRWLTLLGEVRDDGAREELGPEESITDDADDTADFEW